MLEINNLDVYYGDLQILKDISLSVRKGEFVSVIGPNGAGKSTLLKVISGIIKAEAGQIKMLDYRIETLSPHEVVKVGFVHIPEDRNLFNEMTVLENLEMGAYIDEARKKRGKSLEKVFELFPKLKERQNQQASTLSGGEQRMLAIARGLMSSPKILALDEPSMGLAPQLSEKLFNTIEELREELQVLLVEQKVRKALELADRAYLLEEGRIVEEGTGKELMESNHVKEVYLGEKGEGELDQQ